VTALALSLARVDRNLEEGTQVVEEVSVPEDVGQARARAAMLAAEQRKVRAEQAVLDEAIRNYDEYHWHHLGAEFNDATRRQRLLVMQDALDLAFKVVQVAVEQGNLELVVFWASILGEWMDRMEDEHGPAMDEWMADEELGRNLLNEGTAVVVCQNTVHLPEAEADWEDRTERLNR
jgi:hypothetical protein